MVTDMLKSIAIDLPRPAASTAGSGTKARDLGPAPPVEQGEQGAEASQSATAAQSQTNAEDLREAVRELNSYVQNVQRNLQFSVDEGSERTVIKVIDAQTEELVRQIPSEEVLALARHLREMSSEQVSGLLVQGRA